MGAQTNMAMTADEIVSHPALERCIRGRAQALLSIQDASPRMASIFATRQRWLMAHAALAQYFRNEANEAGTGLLAERFLEILDRHDIASRNTGSAFLKEMLKYDVIRFVESSAGRRLRPMEPSPAVLMALFGWHALHLAALDGLDGGARVATLHARPALVRAIQPLIADRLIGSDDVRKPERTISLFVWFNEGGLVMDRLIVGCQQPCDGLLRIPTDVTSVSSLARKLSLSRTQLGRKFAEAEAMGSLGWTRTRGKSRLWLSSDFRREYHCAQALKLAIVDSAFDACVGRDEPARCEAALA